MVLYGVGLGMGRVAEQDQLWPCMKVIGGCLYGTEGACMVLRMG